MVDRPLAEATGELGVGVTVEWPFPPVPEPVEEVEMAPPLPSPNLWDLLTIVVPIGAVAVSFWIVGHLARGA